MLAASLASEVFFFPLPPSVPPLHPPCLVFLSLCVAADRALGNRILSSCARTALCPGPSETWRRLFLPNHSTPIAANAFN